MPLCVCSSGQHTAEMHRLLGDVRRLIPHTRTAARLALVGTTATGYAVCEHPDAKWFREQAEHQALGLSAVQEAKLGQWYEVARKCREGDPNEADDRGVSVLHIAAKNGKKQLVEILLQLGAVSRPDKVQGRTPLHYAAACGHTATMELLLEAGADPAAADAAGATPLHLAAQEGERFAARLLLRWCEDPNVRDIYGVAPLHKAVAFGNVGAVQTLLADRRTRVDQPVGEVTAPDHHAALSGGETALILAASHTYHFHHTKHTRIAALLLDAGADPNVRASGQTAAHYAAKSGNAGVVGALLRNGRTQWDLRDADGRTPLALATKHKHAEVVKLLTDRGVRRQPSSGK